MRDSMASAADSSASAAPRHHPHLTEAATSASSPSSTTSQLLDPKTAQKLRAEMVNAARQFCANPRVRRTPLAEQKAFLSSKGLTEAEIDAAFDGGGGGGNAVGAESHQLHQIPLPHFQQVHHPIARSAASHGGNVVFDFAKTAVLLGSTGYIFYRAMRSFMLPYLFGVPDPAEERIQRLEAQIAAMADSNRAIAASVSQTLGTLSEQNEQINRTLLLIQSGQAASSSSFSTHHNNIKNGGDKGKLLTELGVIKSLLLGQHQFPPIPEHSLASPSSQPKQNGIAKIPAWQLGSSSTSRNVRKKNISQNGVVENEKIFGMLREEERVEEEEEEEEETKQNGGENKGEEMEEEKEGDLDRSSGGSEV